MHFLSFQYFLHNYFLLFFHNVNFYLMRFKISFTHHFDLMLLWSSTLGGSALGRSTLWSCRRRPATDRRRRYASECCVSNPPRGLSEAQHARVHLHSLRAGDVVELRVDLRRPSSVVAAAAGAGSADGGGRLYVEVGGVLVSEMDVRLPKGKAGAKARFFVVAALRRGGTSVALLPPAEGGAAASAEEEGTEEEGAQQAGGKELGLLEEAPSAAAKEGPRRSSQQQRKGAAPSGAGKKPLKPDKP